MTVGPGFPDPVPKPGGPPICMFPGPGPNPGGPLKCPRPLAIAGGPAPKAG